MSARETPCLSLAIARLTAAGPENFATWVIQSPLPGGYVHHDSIWSPNLTQKWLNWQEMFALQSELHIPVPHRESSTAIPNANLPISGSKENYGGRLMQDLGISLWQWVFDDPIRQSLAQSRGIAMGKNQPLRVRLEIRDPNLIPLPWEIMQPEVGKQSLSLDPHILFSRTTANVDPLAPQRSGDILNILLVLGQEEQSPDQRETRSEIPRNASSTLQLDTEAAALVEAFEEGARTAVAMNSSSFRASTSVRTLVQPTPAQLIDALDTGMYNVMFYAGHGIPAPDGGLLFLGPNAMMNGTELAQVLVRNRVVLAVFNACWGAQPDRIGQQTIERSSLAEVLIHHGVPAVLGMRDPIADREAISFIQAFTKALAQRLPIDRAVQIARQQLLTLYKFNHPAWTLPILYMHPQFNGELLQPIEEGITQLPTTIPSLDRESFPVAYLRFLDSREKIWRIYGGLMRVGRHPENDLVLQERWVGRRHAEIICRETPSKPNSRYTYFLRDFSRFGTLVYYDGEWQKVHHQEFPLKSGVQLKFGSPYGQILEFAIEGT
jgi:CHAT domain/FHA domain